MCVYELGDVQCTSLIVNLALTRSFCVSVLTIRAQKNNKKFEFLIRLLESARGICVQPQKYRERHSPMFQFTSESEGA